MKKHGKALLTILLAALLLGACSPTALAEEALSEPSETVEEPAPAEGGEERETGVTIEIEIEIGGDTEDSLLDRLRERREERETAREEREAAREERRAERAAQRAERKAEREAEREARREERTAERAERRAQREAEREERRAQREAERETRRAERESARTDPSGGQGQGPSAAVGTEAAAGTAGSIPKTGDESQTALWAALALLSMAGLTLILRMMVWHQRPENIEENTQEG